MKWPALVLGLSGTACAAICSIQTKRTTSVVITGDIAGYLAPCGCTSPMTGGIARQASLIRRLRQSSDVLLLVNGALISGNSKQDQLKAETLAQTFGALNASAINLSPEDAKLGIGALEAIQNLSDQKLVTGSLESLTALPIHTSVQSGKILVGGVSTHPEDLARPLGARPVAAGEAVKRLIEVAKQDSLAAVLMLDGTEEEAKSIGRQFPDLRLIVYRSPNDSPLQPLREGHTLIVTPGQRGKSVLRLTFDGQYFDEYSIQPLGPEFNDDAQIDRFCKAYLKRVDQAGLIEHWPRTSTEPYAGTATCGKCHANDYKIWAHSKHAEAFASLEKQGHGRDPDCVSCHVIGLSSTVGFRSRNKTPDLANVGCESCHGPGALHSRNPVRVKVPKIGTAICIVCHTSDQSPDFKILTSWEKIKHR